MGNPSKECVRRLAKDYKLVQQTPPPYVTAHPEGDNILVWHYTIEGPPGSPYAGGFYHGKLLFPADYPFQPPSVMMMTPNGRFRTGQRLCFSMTDFHPKEWNPLWSVSSILTGLLSFMLDDVETYGSMSSSTEARRLYARETHAFNLESPVWVDLFPELADRSRALVASGCLDTCEGDATALQQLQEELHTKLEAEGAPAENIAGVAGAQQQQQQGVGAAPAPAGSGSGGGGVGHLQSQSQSQDLVRTVALALLAVLVSFLLLRV